MYLTSRFTAMRTLYCQDTRAWGGILCLLVQVMSREADLASLAWPLKEELQHKQALNFCN